MSHHDSLLAKATKMALARAASGEPLVLIGSGPTLPEYVVEIEQKIVRRVRVSARSAAAARAQIEAYGNQEAWSDFPCADETSNTRIVSTKPLR